MKQRKWFWYAQALLVAVATGALLLLASRDNAEGLEHDWRETQGVIAPFGETPLLLSAARADLYCFYTVAGRRYALRASGYREGDTVRVRYSAARPFVGRVMR